MILAGIGCASAMRTPRKSGLHLFRRSSPMFGTGLQMIAEPVARSEAGQACTEKSSPARLPPRGKSRTRACAQAYRRATARNPKRFPDKIQADAPLQADGGSGSKADFERECRKRGLFELPPPELKGHVERINGAWRYEFYATWAPQRQPRRHGPSPTTSTFSVHAGPSTDKRPPSARSKSKKAPTFHRH